MKKLMRSREDKMVSGVMGGLGAYFSVDPVIFRLVFVLLFLGTASFRGSSATSSPCSSSPKSRSSSLRGPEPEEPTAVDDAPEI